MSLRGRGALEIRRSENPFFQSVGADIGLTAQNANFDWKLNGNPPPMNAKPYKVDGNFAFLYTRESDMIGSKVNKPQVSETRMLTRSEFLKQRREKAWETMTMENVPTEEPVTQKPTAEDFLRTYHHASKEEDPRYTTAGNEYGKKAPSVATVVTERAVRPQGFSKSFQNIKPKNTSLTTSLTKSNVHKSLDPQFL